jgi:hypothetical protein
MANFLTSNEKFHVFSKSPVTGSQALSQAVNKSGHTITASDIWAQEIPWFYATDSQANAIKYSKNAKTNDLVDINGSVYIRKDTTKFPYDAAGSFDSMWSAYDLSANPVLKNSAGEEVLRYHEGVSASLLTTANNANQASNFAARIWVDGHLIEQFVASTDKILDGFPSTGYGVSLWNGSTPISEGELDDNFIANSYAGVIQLNKNWGSLNPNFKVNCFEYTGKKLDAEIKRLSDAASGEVTLTPNTAEGKTGIVIERDDEESTSFTIGIDQEVIATKESVDDLAGVISGVSQAVTDIQTEITTGSIATNIAAAQSAAEEAQSTAEEAQSAAEAAQAAAEAAAGEAQAAKEFVQNTAKWEAGTDEELGDFTPDTKSGVVTGTTVKTVADEVLNLAKSYSESLHTTSFEYVVLGDRESLPDAGPNTLGKIYLVKEGNIANGEGIIDAISGSYVEYLTRKIGDGESATYAWEQIGTTAADLSQYAKTSEVVTSITDGKGTTAKGAITIKDGRETVYEKDLWGTSVTMSNNGVITVSHKYLSNPNGSSSTPYAWYGTITKVENNKAYIGDDIKANIQTEYISNGTSMFDQNLNLSSFSGDLSNLTTANRMFLQTKIPSFNSDMPKLTNGHSMFYKNKEISSFDADLVNLKIGDYMFYCCSKLSSFNTTTLSNLRSATKMFSDEGTNNPAPIITSFNYDLPRLTTATYMFSGCSSLKSFSGDLGNLTTGSGMFNACKLDASSLMNIINFIPQRDNMPTTEEANNGIGVITIGLDIPNTEEAKQALAEEICCSDWAELELEFSNKNWIVRFQANGEEATYSLRSPKPSTAVYAKLEEVNSEETYYTHASYDGTKHYIISWHHCSNTDSAGYDYFNSLEEAIAEWNIFPA